MLQEHVTNYLTAYCHGELGADDSCRVAHHLRACAKCRAEFEEVRFSVTCGEHLVKVQAPEGLWNQIEGALADPARLAKAAAPPPRWHVLLDFVPSWPVAVAACATLVLGVFVGVRMQNSSGPGSKGTFFGNGTSRSVQTAQLLPVDLGAYLAPIQATPRAESYDVVTSAPPKFEPCEKKTLLDLGLTHVLEHVSPLEGFQLRSTRFQDYDGRRVVQIVYAGAGEAFSVFVGPRDVEFRFGQEHSYQTALGGIPTTKVDCPYQKSYAFAGGQRKFVIISKSLDEQRALQVMQFFLNAELISAAQQ